MQRDLSSNLNEWVRDDHRKPLVIRGARQVGKSWLVKRLGKQFSNFVEINFDRNPELASLFEQTVEPQKLINLLSNYSGIQIIAGKTLLFLDEIQICRRAITSLRYFYEEMPDLHVIAAGSLLDFELNKISIPVGRISFLYVYPLSFGEFLSALKKENLRKMIIENEANKLPEIFHNQLINFTGIYSFIGGMPEVVQRYIDTDDLKKCMEIQSDILQTYKKDFNKYAKKHQIKYLEKVFTSIPFQTGTKFKFVSVSRDHKSKDLLEALDMLCMAGVANIVYHSSSNGVPIHSEIDIKKFKVFFFDIGLAQRILGLDFRPLMLNPDISQINNGAIAELFTAQELTAYSNPREEYYLHYWHREAKSSNAEIDFVIEKNGIIIPIEVKSGSVGKMRSLKLFMESKKTICGIKISTYPFSLVNNVQSIPFYGIEVLSKKSLPCSKMNRIVN
ncbi:MAG: hypothetical protein DRP58_06485 [Spirochaetes bacterium]|nr:MAG: hypothetical protein DRP58_06485 [Spirochaetota bacterium]